MLTFKNSMYDTMLQGARQATRDGLKMQQDMLTNWTRYWPGFTGRSEAPAGGLHRFQDQVADGFRRVAEFQRDVVTGQFDAAITAFDDMVSAVTETEKELIPEKAAAAPPAAAPVAEKPAAPARPAPPPVTGESIQTETMIGPVKNILNKVALVTGAASGIGEAVSRELARRGAKAVLLVDRSEAVNDLAKEMNKTAGREVAEAMIGDTTDEAFRKRVFNMAADKYGIVTICVPAAGITRDSLAVKVDKETGKASVYPLETFRQVTEVNLLAPIYWGMEMVARIAEDRKQRGLKRWEPEETIQGVVVFLGSVSSQGNKGQISYAVAKAGLEGAAATLTKEAIFHGVRCGIIHPGFTDTPMARSLGEDFLNKYVLPYTQLRRLIQPEEIADAICFMISNSAVSGELWADAGWHPPA
jgi:3-oxoacyl-[acyl-carrier protein] reductase